MKLTSPTTAVVIFMIMVFSLALGVPFPVGKAGACEVQEQGWEVPALEGLKAEMVGNNEEGGNKFKTEAFILNEHLFVARLSCNGNIFTYAFDENADGSLDYWIVDGDGDGIFETLCYPDDESIIPDWVKK